MAPMEQIVGPYRLVRLLGRGGFSEVWEAEGPTGERVALKWMSDSVRSPADRVRRERNALALLNVPGVVRLQDHGTHGGRAYVVMELVQGEPFPAGRRAWTDLEPLVRSLLSTLGQVHGAGLVHRDLKPANVLVDTSGTPVVLDFGLVRGSVLGPKITQSGSIMGTPAYLAPEQLRGEACDHRADLYALGVMLFEALAGQLPHEFHDLSSLWVARLMKEAPELPVAAGPAAVSALVRALLAREPKARPADCAEALRILSDEDHEGDLPWLGTTRLQESLWEAASQGRSVEVVGPAGSGKSRQLSEFKRRAERSGLRTLTLASATSPFGSVPSTWMSQGPSGVTEFAEAFLADGGVLLVDDVASMDRWTRDMLDAVQEQGVVVASRTANDGVNVPSLTTMDLRQLFGGSDRVFRLRSDAAQELWRRTGGNPRQVVQELQNWTAHGLAVRDGLTFEVTREQLDQLSAGVASRVKSGGHPDLEPGLTLHLDWTAWVGELATAPVVAAVSGVEPWQAELERQALVDLGWIREHEGVVVVDVSPRMSGGWSVDVRAEAHRRAFLALPENSTSWLEHALGTGDRDTISDAVSSYLLSCAERGQHRHGLSMLDRVVGSGTPLASTTQVRWLCIVMATSLASEYAARSAKRVLGTLAEAEASCMALAQALEDCAARRFDRALARLEATSFDEVRLEACRLELVVRVAFEDHTGSRDELAASIVEERRTVEPDWLKAKRHTWSGALHMRAGRFAAALEDHERALELRTWRSERVSSLNNMSLAAIWAGRFDEAVRAANEALGVAHEIRHFEYAGVAECRLRAVAHRRGERTPDLELVSVHGDHADTVWTEAIIACRGEHPSAERLVRRARELGRIRGLLVQVTSCDCMLAYLGLADWADVDLSGMPEQLLVDANAMRARAPVGEPPLTGVLR